MKGSLCYSFPHPHLSTENGSELDVDVNINATITPLMLSGTPRILSQFV
jgi:hypothetical protein